MVLWPGHFYVRAHMARVFFFLYLALVVIAAMIGFIDPPGQTNCSNLCGAASFLAAVTAGLPWSALALGLVPGLNDSSGYFLCWPFIGLNLFLLSRLAFASIE